MTNTVQPSKTKGILMAIVGATLWGLSGIAGQYLFQQRGVEVPWLISTRMISSGIILLLFAYLKKQDIQSIWKDKKDRNRIVLFGLIGLMPVQYTYFKTVSLSNAATATVLQYAGPVIIALYLALKNRKLPSFIEIIALSFAVLGTYLLVTHGERGKLLISEEALIMGIISAISLAVHTLQPRALLEKYSAICVTGWAMLIGGIGISFYKAPWQISGQWDINALLCLAVIIIFGTVIAFQLFMTALKILGGQTASLLASAEPLAATVFGVCLMGTTFTFIDWVGSLLILSTLFILTLKKRTT